MVVLLDLVMPVMDGFATMERLLNYDPKTNIIICSSLQQKFYISRALKAGAKEFLVKPFRKEQVQTIVHRMLLGTNVIHQYPRYLMLD
jgi:two-component system chemotaxis response regulator CheY